MIEAMAPRVSALIPCYEMEHCVEHAVQSAIAQEGDALEIVVVDDGSQADPGPALARFGERVRLIRQENGGVSAARNRAAAEATGEWLAFLDADDRWLPEKTRLTLAALADTPQARFAYGLAEGHGEDGQRKVLGAAPPATRRGVVLSLLGGGNPIPNLTGFVHRDAFSALGGFDDSLPCAEDYDLWLRLAEQYDVAFVDRPVATYHMHAGGAAMGDVDRWVRTVERVHARVLARYPGDDEVARAIVRGDAAMRLERGFGRLCSGDRRGAREDFEAALACPSAAAEARRLLRHTHLPAPIYAGLRRLLAR